jgi:hypothetical protein
MRKSDWQGKESKREENLKVDFVVTPAEMMAIIEEDL